MVLHDTDLLALHDTIAKANDRGVAIGTLLTGKGQLEYGQTSYYSQSKSESQEMANTSIVVADNREVLIASTDSGATATTTNRKVVMVARQFVWMELLT